MIFNDAPHGNPGFQGKYLHFLSTENLLAPFTGRVSELWAIFYYFRNQKRVGSLKKNKKLFDMGWVFLFFLRKFSKSGRGSLKKKKFTPQKRLFPIKTVP